MTILPGQQPQENKPLRVRLESFGDPRETWKWKTGEVDYIAKLGLTAGDVPELLAIAKEWTEPMDWPDDEKYVAGYAPIHAWRGLAQLGAIEAAGVFLDMMGPLGADGDDWYLEEFPHAFAWIGPGCLEDLAKYLADARHTTYPRTAAAGGLKELAQRHPEARRDVVEALCRTLSRLQESDDALNGFIIADLLDLKATEAAEPIERAYAADCVEIGICGNWDIVRKELGVAGLGLVPEELASMKWSWLPDVPADQEDDEALFHGGQRGLASTEEEDSAGPVKASKKVGRNEPCPCGSGKKYKKCCGR